MISGTVKWFNSQKGYGFIAPNAGGSDAFVHVRSLERAGIADLRDGQRVEYELISDRRTGKTAAENLRFVD